MAWILPSAAPSGALSTVRLNESSSERSPAPPQGPRRGAAGALIGCDERRALPHPRLSFFSLSLRHRGARKLTGGDERRAQQPPQRERLVQQQQAESVRVNDLRARRESEERARVPRRVCARGKGAPGGGGRRHLPVASTRCGTQVCGRVPPQRCVRSAWSAWALGRRLALSACQACQAQTIRCEAHRTHLHEVERAGLGGGQELEAPANEDLAPVSEPRRDALKDDAPPSLTTRQS